MSTTTSTILSASPKSTLSTHPDVNFLNVLPISEAGDGDIELAHVSAKPDISRSTSPSLINTDPQLRAPSSALGLRGRSIGVSPTEAPENATDKRSVPADDDGEEEYPEGGDGWLVLFGIFVIFFLYFGLMFSWGVIQGRLVQRGLAPSSTLAFIGSTTNLLQPTTALLIGRVVRRLGNVATAIIAVCLISLGELLASFCTHSVAGLVVTQGAVVGLGCSFAYMSGSPLPSQYFKKRRGLATGLIFAGGGLGGAVMSISMNYLLDRIDIEWTYRVISLIILVCGLPAATLMKPRNKKMGYGKFVEWSLFKDAKFVLLLVMAIIATFPIFVPPFFIPQFATSIGFSSGAGAGLLAGWNLGSATGRIGAGFLADSKLLGPRRTAPLVTMFLTLVLTGGSMLTLWTFSSTLAPLIVFVILNGAGAGAYTSLMPTVCGCVFGSSKMATALGMVFTGFSFGNFMGAPIAGYLLDAYGGPGYGIQAYRPAMYYAGSLSLASAGLVASVVFLVGREHRDSHR